MLRKVLVVVAVAAIVVFWFSGCKKSSDESGAEAPKTMVDYEAEAKEEITEENLAEELAKLEKEVEAETSPRR
ncbi:MAG: hypothetical protein ACYS83_05285 [Planctomycetota bacterium]|jgi:uncharacterized membrane protein